MQTLKFYCMKRTVHKNPVFDAAFYSLRILEHNSREYGDTQLQLWNPEVTNKGTHAYNTCFRHPQDLGGEMLQPCLLRMWPASLRRMLFCRLHWQEEVSPVLLHCTVSPRPFFEIILDLSGFGRDLHRRCIGKEGRLIRFRYHCHLRIWTIPTCVLL